MKLSVIIVNYNVKYFLEQCLYTLSFAGEAFKEVYGENAIEIIVVDNASNDRSIELVKDKFPEVKVIQNQNNLGFSKANNQGIRISKGEFVLLLNPDTVIREDTLVKAANFMDLHPDAGGLGVKMMDGRGRFLPESKRGFPSPRAAFYKVFGLSALFPRSRRFSSYRLGFLSMDEVNEVDVLSGAFMLLRKDALDKCGLLDEDFFMYGEDIDLSYRIKQAGYKNYYYPETEIIHYKGESTKKGSLNYVYMFYNAMIIFAGKHFKSSYTCVYTSLIKAAVWLRAVISAIKRIFDRMFLPVADMIMYYAGFFLLTPLWESYRFGQKGYYPPEYMNYAVPMYILIWITMISLSKGYKKPVSASHLFKGILIGTIIILVIYSLLNEQYRYSRALLIIGSIWAGLSSWVFRLLMRLIGLRRYSFKRSGLRLIMITGTEEHIPAIKEILNNSGPDALKSFEFVTQTRVIEHKELDEIIENKRIDEVIFDYSLYRPSEIIQIVSKLRKQNVECKTYVPDSQSVVGSNSIHSSGEIYVSDMNHIIKPGNIRLKRMSDVIIALLFLMMYPILVLLVDRKWGFLRNIIAVLSGRFSWVGYVETEHSEFIKRLPTIKRGILHPVVYSSEDADDIFKINAYYAINYNLTDDIFIIYKSFYYIGNKKF